MREIKFRAWEPKNKNFAYAEPSGPGWVINGSGPDIFTERLPWEQFTGLKDRNGKEIYEGDVLELGGVRGLIIFLDGSFCLDVGSETQVPSPFHPDRAALYQVIGNIHENPELLAKESPNVGGEG